MHTTNRIAATLVVAALAIGSAGVSAVALSPRNNEQIVLCQDTKDIARGKPADIKTATSPEECGRRTTAVILPTQEQLDRLTAEAAKARAALDAELDALGASVKQEVARLDARLDNVDQLLLTMQADAKKTTAALQSLIDRIASDLTRAIALAKQNAAGLGLAEADIAAQSLQLEKALASLRSTAAAAATAQATADKALAAAAAAQATADKAQVAAGAAQAAADEAAATARKALALVTEANAAAAAAAEKAAQVAIPELTEDQLLELKKKAAEEQKAAAEKKAAEEHKAAEEAALKQEQQPTAAEACTDANGRAIC